MPLQHDTRPVEGRRGIITATIGTNIEELAEVKNLTATFTKNKSSYRVLGDPADRHKSAGWTGAGSFTYHWVTSRWQKMLIDYAKTGVDIYFTMVVTNDDPGSSAGRNSVKLGQCNIDGGDIALIDIDTDMLESSCDFTFSEVDSLEAFNELF